MLIKHTYKVTIIAVVFLFVFNIPTSLADQLWREIETKHTIIRYKTDQDLLKFHKSIKYGLAEWNKSPTWSTLSNAEIQKMLIKKIDAIFERTQTILDMKKKFKKLAIIIHSNAEELKKAYRSIYGGECKIRAWYRYRNNSVYLNAKDVFKGMLAHELAHGIIDHYLMVKPPGRTAEILATYVDAHL